MKKKYLLAVLVFPLMFLTGCTQEWRATRQGRADLIRLHYEMQFVELEQEMQGRAALMRAEYEMQIIELEAQSRLRAEVLHAEAEIVRAEGIAAAMKIINDDISVLYLHHFWIRTMAEHGNVVYVATEANLPIIPSFNQGQPVVAVAPNSNTQ
ncbi:MAG: hypothetical protein FWG63_03005 [Defluviitaleaceae bacterium]|nr:hypothetical protein [Defluviitaleaceae bacterium]